MPHRECSCCPVVNKKPAKLHSDVLTPVLKRPVGLPLLLSSDTVKTFPSVCYFLILYLFVFLLIIFVAGTNMQWIMRLCSHKKPGTSALPQSRVSKPGLQARQDGT